MNRDWFDYATALGTAGAAVFAGLAAHAAAGSTRQTKRLVDLEVERRDEEKRSAGSAAVNASLVGRRSTSSSPFGGGWSSWVEIRNSGPAPAEDLRLEQDAQKMPDGIADIDVDDLPSTLAAGQTIRLATGLWHSDGALFGRITIHYRDAGGEHSLLVHPEMLPTD